MRNNRYLVIILLLLLAFGLRVHRLTELGTQADEGVHVTIANRLVAGDLLYRDLFENHTPGVDLLLAAVFKATGSNVLIGRFLSVGAAMLTLAGLMSAGRQLDSSQPQRTKNKTADVAGFLAALLFACAPLPIFWSRFGMLENLETAFATLSMACALRGLKRQTWHWWLLAGIMAGFALLIKVSALVLVGTLGLFIGLWWLVRRDREPLLAGLLVVFGFVLALLPLALMLIVQGTGANFFHFLSTADRLAPLFDWPNKLSVLLKWAVKRPFIPLALLGGLLALLARRPAYFLLSIWAGAELTALWLPSRVNFDWGGFSHYALPAVAATSLLAGGGLAWGWQAFVAKPRLRLALIGLPLLLVVPTCPGLARDLNYVVRETTYPLPGFATEAAVGRALALVTPGKEPILVFANSIFYHWADRPPANRYFQYPAYLSTSSLAAKAEAELTATLSGSEVRAVLLSRLHADRLPQAVMNALFERWVPAAIFPYPYQKDVILYLPQRPQTATALEPVTFEAGQVKVFLNALEVDVLSPATLLVRLDWSTRSPLNENYTIFTHLIGPDGTLVTQHDSWPAIGFCPTTTWKPDELIVDYHWLELPPGAPVGAYELRVGLYQASTGQRLNVPATDKTFIATHVQLQP